MKNIELKGEIRKNIGKKESVKLRKGDQIPCVIYGGKENLHFSVIYNDFRHLIYTPNVYLVNLDIEGKKFNAILKETQFHPVTDKIIHADFLEIFDDKPVIVSLPIELSGNSIGIKDGGKLRQKRRTLKVKGLPTDLPESLNIDVTNIDIGTTLKVGDLNFKNIEILDPHQSMVISVVSPKVAAKGMELDEPETETEETVEGVEGEAESSSESQDNKEEKAAE